MSLSHKILCIATLAVALLATGCTPGPSTTYPAPGQRDRLARSLVSEGRFLEAADEYLRLGAESKAPVAQYFGMAAVSALIRAQEIPAAKTLIAGINVQGLGRAYTVRRNLLQIRIALAENRTDEATAQLAKLDFRDLPPDLLYEGRSVRALALAQGGDPLAAVRERVALELLLTDPLQIDENRRLTWHAVTSLGETELERLAVPPPDSVGGWLELAVIAKRYGSDPTALDDAIAQWRLRFPGHPASESIVNELVDASRMQAQPPDHIALLLPFDGPFAKAAEAVRDGFLAAWFGDGTSRERPVVTILDTSGNSPGALYEQAVANGADFVVGPLRKEGVRELGELGSRPITTLALNLLEPGADPDPVETAPEGEQTRDAATTPETTIPGATTGNGSPPSMDTQDPGARPAGTETKLPDADSAPIYQFALSPEGEAAEVAKRAWFDGHVQAAVLTPEGAWGDRVAKAFTESWENLGGIVLERQSYPGSAKDMAAPVRNLLNIDESVNRERALRQFLRLSFEFQPRRRQDIDFIFLAAFSRQARQIRPQLSFQHAGDVPVYATSHVYGGTESPARDRDVDGVRFGDMPWVLEEDAEGAEIRRGLRQLWPGSVPSFIRFYALGIDAYRIIPHLGRLKAQQYSELAGATGRLRVDEENRVRRQLSWAYFEAGKPRLLDGPQGSL